MLNCLLGGALGAMAVLVLFVALATVACWLIGPPKRPDKLGY